MLSLHVSSRAAQNWFQNRRAKVKQDLKKQMSANNMFYATLPIHSPYLPPSYDQYPPASSGQDLYPAHTAPSMFGLPADTLDPQATNAAVNTRLHLQQSFGAPLQPISESSQPGSYDGILHNLAAAGYNMQAMNMASVDLSGPFVNVSQPAHSQNYLGDAQFPLSLDFAGMAEPFGEHTNGMPPEHAFNYQTYVPSCSAPAQTLESSGSLSSERSASSSMHSLSTQPSTIGTSTVQSVDSTCSPWNDDRISPTDISPGHSSIGTTGNTQRGNPYTLQGDISSPWSSLQPQPYDQFMQPPSALSDASQVAPTLVPSVSAPEQVGSMSPQLTFSDSEQSGTLPPEAFSRRASSTTALAESMRNVGIQSRPPVDASFKQPTQPSSIAVRRQRPRPAALGTTGLRSVSYSAGMSSPPNATQSLNPDHTLRRIRSIGVTNGLPNGRIQKPGSVSAQRSPLTFTFAEAAASPKFARQNSFVSITSPEPPCRTESLAPPTPLTPNEFGRFPSWQSHIVKTHATALESSNAEGRVWPRDLSVPATHASVASPPSTPMNPEQLVQYRPHLQTTPVFRDTPPQSAPATQQSFQRTSFMPQTQPIADVHATADYSGLMNRGQHSRRPSLPDSAVGLVSQDQMQWGIPMFNAAGELQLDYSMQIKQAPITTMPQQQQQQHTPPQQIARAFQLPGSSLEPSASQKSVVMPDFFVHEYSPPQAAGQKSSSLRPQDTQPKNYTFENKGPRNFESP